MAANACLQALVKAEGCQAILQKGLPEAEAAIPSTEMQSKLQEVPSSAPLYMTSMIARNASCLQLLHMLPHVRMVISPFA